MGVQLERIVAVGIEFERTLKAPERYKELERTLASERYLRTVLYLSPDVHIANYLCDVFERIREINLYVCLLPQFLQDPWNVRVRSVRHRDDLPLRTLS